MTLVESLCLVGAFFVLTAGLGLARFPDFYTRMQAPTKAATMGKGLIVVGAMLHFWDLAVTASSLTLLAFFYLTAPVAAHVIGRAAYRAGVPLWERTEFDELDRDRRR